MTVFAGALRDKLNAIKEIAFAPSSKIRTVFSDRTQEQGGIKHRWEGILDRLEAADVGELYGYIISSPELRFRSQGLSTS